MYTESRITQAIPIKFFNYSEPIPGGLEVRSIRTIGISNKYERIQNTWKY